MSIFQPKLGVIQIGRNYTLNKSDFISDLRLWIWQTKTLRSYYKCVQRMFKNDNNYL